MIRGRYQRAVACAVPLLACASCALQPSPPVAPALPDAFQNRAAAAVQWPGKDWYQGFGSPELDALITAAARSNLDVEAARARLSQADARAREAGAAILPSVDAGG